MRPDYCPVGGEPCQSLCDVPCTTNSEMKRLRKLAQAVLDTRSEEAKACLTMQNAEENFSDAKPEIAKYERAMLAASKAEKELRAALETPNVELTGDPQLHRGASVLNAKLGAVRPEKGTK